MKKLFLILTISLISLITYGQSWVPIGYNAKFLGQAWFTKNTLFSDTARFAGTMAVGAAADSTYFYSTGTEFFIKKGTLFNKSFINGGIFSGGYLGLGTKSYEIWIYEDALGTGLLNPQPIQITGNALFNNNVTVSGNTILSNLTDSSNAAYQLVTTINGDIYKDTLLNLTEYNYSNFHTDSLYVNDFLQINGARCYIDSILLLDDGSITLPTGTAGMGTVMCGDNLAWCNIAWTSAGVVSIFQFNGLVISSNTDAYNIAVYDSGTTVTIKYTGGTVSKAFLLNLIIFTP